MLFQNTAVLYRHLPPAKLDQPRIQGAMLVIEWGAFKRSCLRLFCCHTHCSIAVLRIRLYASQYHILRNATNFLRVVVMEEQARRKRRACSSITTTLNRLYVKLERLEEVLA